MTTIKPFARDTGYTEFNNYVLDYVMPKLSPNAWKVLCFVIRQTKGWHKKSDDLSFTQIKRGTGIGSDPTVNKALGELENNNYIIIQRHKRKWDSNTYTLNTTLEIEVENEASTIETIVEPTIEIKVGSTIETIDTKERKPILNKSSSYEDGVNPAPNKKQPIPEAVKVYRKIARRFPDKAIWGKIDNTVGIKPKNLERWEVVVREYIGCGWNKLNINGMLEFFNTDRIPTTKPIPNGAKNNGSYSRHNRQTQKQYRTGADLDREPTFDPATGENYPGVS